MRTLAFLLGALALVTAAADRATAATLTLDSSSTFEVRFGPLPPISVGPAGATPVFVSSAGGSFVEPPAIFETVSTLPDELFTGIPLFQNLRMTVDLGTGTFSASGGIGGGFGGGQPVTGKLILDVLGGLIDPEFPLSAMGVAGGAVVQAGAFTLMVTLTGTGWTTGVARVTGITTFTPGGAAVNTATLAGTDQRTAGHRGTLTLVTPMRVLTNIVGDVPMFGVQTLNFVPEPGPALLLAAAGAALAIVGTRRRRSRRDR